MAGSGTPIYLCSGAREQVCEQFALQKEKYGECVLTGKDNDVCRTDSIDQERFLHCFLTGKDSEEENPVQYNQSGDSSYLCNDGDKCRPLGAYSDCTAQLNKRMCELMGKSEKVICMSQVKRDPILRMVKDARSYFSSAVLATDWQSHPIDLWTRSPINTLYYRVWNAFLMDYFGLGIDTISAPLFGIAKADKIELELNANSLNNISAVLSKRMTEIFPKDMPAELKKDGVVIVLRHPNNEILSKVLEQVAHQIYNLIQEGVPVYLVLGSNEDNDDINWVMGEYVEFEAGKGEKFIYKHLDVSVGSKSLEMLLAEIRPKIKEEIQALEAGRKSGDKREISIVLRLKDVPQIWEDLPKLQEALRDYTIVFVTGDKKVTETEPSAQSDTGVLAGELRSAKFRMSVADYYLVGERRLPENVDYVDEVRFLEPITVAEVTSRCLTGEIANFCAINYYLGRRLRDSHNTLFYYENASLTPYSLSMADPTTMSSTAWNDASLNMSRGKKFDLAPLRTFYEDDAHLLSAKLISVSIEAGMTAAVLAKRFREIGEQVLKLKGGITKGRELRFDFRVGK